MITYLRNIESKLNTREKTGLLLLTLSDAAVNVVDIAFLGGLVLLINAYTDPGYVHKIPLRWQAILQRQPLLPALAFLVLFAAKNALGYFLLGAQFRFMYGVAARLSTTQLQHYLNSGYSSYVLTDSSVHLNRISNQPIEFSQHVLRSLQQILSQGLLIVVTIAGLLIYSPKLFLLLLALLLPVSLVIARLMRRQLLAVRQHTKKTWENTSRHLSEALSGYIESNIYDKSAFFTSRYTQEQERLFRYYTRQQSVQGLPSRAIEVLAVGGFVILILFNQLLTGKASTPVITIGAFMAAAYKIIPGIVNILTNTGMMKTHSYTIAGMPDAGTVMRRKPEPWTEREEDQKPGSGPDRAPDMGKGQKPGYGMEKIISIRFEGVHFGYGGEPLLSDFNLQAEAGDCIAISGVSGRGKTTLAHLLLGFISPDKGNIRINHMVTDARERKQYWPAIAYVQQRPFLFNDTVLRNITLEEETGDKARLRMAVKAAGLTGPANGPLGLHRIIRENGKNLSGGQRQRIAFARALYKDFDLLILDEPFSELDEASENRMLEYLNKLSAEGKTILLITHHKTNFFFCNKIVSLDGA